jgi:uncharacterized protein HemY
VITVAESFVLLAVVFAVGMCVSLMSLGHFNVAEIGCNWYIYDVSCDININIFIYLLAH